MPSLKTLGGMDFYFPAASVTMVADHDDTGQPGTFVYGVGPVALGIAESSAAFLARLGLTNAFITLTRPNAVTIWANPAAIAYVRAAGAGDPAPEKSEISISNHIQRLVEDAAAVTAKVNAKIPGRF